MLAGLFKAPTKYAPHRNLPAARARANEVLTNLVQASFMTEGQVVHARRNPAVTVAREETADAPDYFLDWAFQEAKRLSVGFPTNTFVVRTTVDPALQRAADEAVQSHLRQYGEQYKVDQASMLVIEHGGEVRAIVGGRDYGESQYNRATNARRQPGSAFKPFVFATAMNKGYKASSVVDGRTVCYRGWCPKNYGGAQYGRVNMTRALVKSVNTVPVRLGLTFGRKPIIETARAMGITSPLQAGPAMVLGTNDLTALELATAYGVFMEGGLETGAHSITRIENTAGEVLYDHARDAPPRRRILSEDAVANMNEIMVQIPEWGTARRAKIPGIKTAGKTGTTQSYRDAWFVGYTGNFTAAVWFGNDSYAPTNDLTGGRLPSMTFQRFMTFAHDDIELRDIPFVKPEKRDRTTPKAPQAPELIAARAQPLSRETTKVLRDLEEALRGAGDVRAPAAAPLPPGPTAAVSAPPRIAAARR